MDKKDMKFKRESLIYEADDREMLFHSVLKCPDGMIRMYTNLWKRKYITVVRESKDGIKFKDPKFVIKSGAAHNFFPFLGVNGTIYAIGGVDAWKMQPRFHETSYEDYPALHFERFGEEWNKSEEVYKRMLEKLDWKFPNMSHTDGLYLFESDDGRHFRQKSKGPIVTVESEGFTSAIVWGKSTEFDGHLSCVWNKDLKKYILYCRENVRQGVRYIQYATSSNLLEWSKFESLKLEGWGNSTENYYSPVIWKHPFKNAYVGTIPYWNSLKQGSVRIIASSDGFNFRVIKDVFLKKCLMLNDAPKTYYQFANGFIVDGDNFVFYLYENYLGLNKQAPVEVWRYTIPIKEFDGVGK